MSDNKLDPRLHAIRSDLADERLKEHFDAPRYVSAHPAQVVEPIASLHAAPRFDAAIDTQALYGETVRVFEEGEGWSWVQLDKDGYVGYTPSERLSLNPSTPNHRINVLRTYVYPAPNIKTPPMTSLSFQSRITATQGNGDFLELNTGGYIYSAHANPIDSIESDFVSVAEKFPGTPYLWGGKSGFGLDCSALIQLSLETCGVKAPRDSDMQNEQLGQPLEIGSNLQGLRRGDLIFWKGHVGVMTDSETLLHSNGYHMLTVIEPLKTAVARIAALYGPMTGVNRL